MFAVVLVITSLLRVITEQHEKRVITYIVYLLLVASGPLAQIRVVLRPPTQRALQNYTKCLRNLKNDKLHGAGSFLRG